MTVTPILLILLAGGVLIAAVHQITPQQAWATMRGRMEAIEEMRRRRTRRVALLHTLPDFLGNLVVGYQVKQQLLEALAFAVRLSPPDDPLSEEIGEALRRAGLSENKYPSLHEAAQRLNSPSLTDLFHLLEEAEETGGDIVAIVESYLENAYARKSAHLLEQAKVLPLKLLGITVPMLLPILIIVIVAPFMFQAMQVWVGK
jgi:hypothetical protein